MAKWSRVGKRKDGQRPCSVFIPLSLHPPSAPIHCSVLSCGTWTQLFPPMQPGCSMTLPWHPPKQPQHVSHCESHCSETQSSATSHTAWPRDSAAGTSSPSLGRRKGRCDLSVQEHRTRACPLGKRVFTSVPKAFFHILDLTHLQHLALKCFGGKHLTQHFRCCLGCLHPISKCLRSSPGFAPNSSFL